MRAAAKSRPILLHLASPLPRVFCAEEGILFFHLHGGAGFQRRGNESFSSSSYSSPPHASHSQWRHHDEESKGVKVAVWWDFENCNVPNGVNAFRVPHRITSALRSHGIRGPVSITAFGDVSQLSRSSQDALYTSGVCLNHVPSSGKNSSDRSLLADLVYWVAQNPPPVHFFLISGDRDFANILHRLRMNNYNILLACPDGASGALCSAATVMWQWNTLVRGESLSGRYFSHPPDGLYGSWYGHYKGALDNPFGVFEEATSVQPDESVEPIPDAKVRQIPKLLVNKVRQILHSYPEGITLTDLRAELKKNNVVFDKDYYGHKKFSHMLLSMPNILKLECKLGDVQPLAYSVTHQGTTSPVDTSSKTATGVGNSTGDGGRSWVAENNRKPLPLTPQLDAENPCRKVEMATASRHKAIAAIEQNSLSEEPKIVATHEQGNVATSCEVNVQPSDTQSVHMQKEEAVNTDGLIGRIWKILIAGSSGSSEASISSTQTTSIPCESAQAITSTSVESSSNPERMGSKEEASVLKTSGSSVASSDLVSTKHAVFSVADEREREIKAFHDPLTSSKTSSAAGQSAPCEANEGTALKHNGAFRNSSFFNKIFTWCRFWRTNPKDHDTFASKRQSNAFEFPRESVEGQGLDLRPVNGTDISHSDSKHESHDLFSKSHFWDSIESFIHTSKGSDIISKSRTREELMCGLRKEGPLVLSALKESHLHQLVNLLITDKKWVKECDSEGNRFKLAFLDKRVCIPSHASGVNGLRSIFLNRTSQPNSGSLVKQETGNQNFQPHGNPSGGSVNSKVPRDALDLKAWFQKSCHSNGCVSLEEFEKHFESTFDRKLDCSLYGYFTMDDLIASCTADADDPLQSKKVPRGREATLSHCRDLLLDFLKHNPQGFNIGLFRPMFFRRYGYVLDYQVLGYPKLASLLQIMPGIKIESTTVLPAAMFLPDSGRKGVTDEASACTLDNNRGIENITDSEDPPIEEDRAWDELGPVSEILEGKQFEEKFEPNESTFADEEFSDPEESPTASPGIRKRQCNGDTASSTFLEVLDNYYSRQGTEDVKKHKAQDFGDGAEEYQMPNAKEGEGVEIRQGQSVDGVVECSRRRDVNPLKTKPLDLMMQKPKSRKSYSFVSE